MLEGKILLQKSSYNASCSQLLTSVMQESLSPKLLAAWLFYM